MVAIFADDTKATKIEDPTKSDHLEANANLDKTSAKSGNTRYLWRLYVPQ